MTARTSSRARSTTPSSAKRFQIAGLSIAATALIAGTAYFGYARVAASAAVEHVPSAAVVRTDIRSTVPADGRTAAATWEPAFAVSGVIESVSATEGSVIEKGDIIARLDDTKATAQVAQAAAALAAARAKLDTLENKPVAEEVDAKQAVFDAAKDAVANAKEAYDLLVTESKESTVTAAELQAKSTAVDSAEGQLEVAEANLAAAKVSASSADLAAGRAAVADALAGLESARAALDDYVLRAPASGILATLDLKPGMATSSSSGQSPAVVIADAEDMLIEGELDEADVSDVTAGMKVEVLVDALDGVSVEGVVDRVAAVAKVSENGLAYYAVSVSVPDAVEGLKSGMAVRMQITTDEAAGVLAVPTAAVRRVGGKAVVNILAKDGGSTPVSVTLGKTDGKLVEVSAGLTEGQKVALPTGGDAL